MSAMAAGEPGPHAKAASRRRTVGPPPGQRALVAVPGRAAPGRRAPAAAPGRPAATVPAQRVSTVPPRRRSAPAGEVRDRLRAAKPRTPALALVPPQGPAAPEQPGMPPTRGIGTQERARPAAPERPRAPRPAPGHETAERERPAARRPPLQSSRAVTRPRSRLTRRGRIVLSTLVVAVILLVAVLAWLGGATRADAARSGPPSSAVYRNLNSVIVQPGESLWAIAAQAEPGADPRGVIQEIIDLNALGGTSIQPGQRLLVPRG